MRHESAHLGQRLDCLRSAQIFFARCYDSLDLSVETLWVAHLDGEGRCTHLSRYDGDETSVPGPLKTIVREAIDLGSAGLVLAHNHPSGDARPSRIDLAATRLLSGALAAVECTVVDHLILAGDDCTSFRSLGLL